MPGNNNLIDSLAIEVVGQAQGAMKDLQSLITNLEGIKGKLAELGSAKIKINSIVSKAAIDNLRSFSDALKGFDTDKLAALGSATQGISKINLGIGEKSAENLTNFSDAINMMDLGRLRAISEIDFSNMRDLADASRVISRLRDRVKELEKTEDKTAQTQEKLARSTVKVTRESRKASSSFNFANTALGKLFNSIKRIAFYRVIRSAIKAVTQGFAEGIENLYYWSQMVGTSFAPRMDQLATATQYLKNGFSSMFSPLIEYAIPIIDNLIDRLVDMFNVVQELFARLTGAATWNKALKYPVTYKDALDDASGSAKALQNILMDFDEINAINTPKSGSRGSGADAKDYSSMFQLMETPTGNPMAGFGKFFEDIAGKVETAYGIVNRFWQFFKGLNFAPFKKSLDDLWNNTLSPIIDDLLEDADWFREKVLQPITQFLVEKGIPAVIDTLSVSVKSLWDAFKPLRDGLKTFWNENGDWIMKLVGDAFLTGLDAIKESFTKIGDFFKNNDKIKSIFENISAIVKGIGESKFFDSLLAFIKTAAFETFMTTIENTLTAIEPVLDILSGIFKILGAIFKKEKNGGKQALEGLEDLGEGLMKLLAAPFEMILRTLADVLDALGTLSPACKDAAHRIRVFIGDEVEEINKDVSNAGVTIRKTAEGTWKAVDETTGEYVSITGARISSAQLAINRETANGISQVLRWGSEGAKSSQQVQQWLEYCRVNGVDPMTGDIIWATEETIGLGKAGQNAAQTTVTAYKNASGQIVQAFSGLPTANQKLIDQIKAQTASLGQYIKNVLGVDVANFAPSAGYTIGSQLKVGIENGLRNLHLNIPATVNIVNTTGSTAAARVHGATFDMSMFANGGFLPSQYSLFAAGEGGVPEMLGTVGGRTAVAGGAEITGIREAIVEQGQREEGLLRSLISAVQNKDLSLVANSATGRWVNRALKAYSGVSG